MSPQFDRVDGLDVKVTVDQNRWFAGGMKPLTVNNRVAAGWKDTHAFNSRTLHSIGNPLGCSLDVASVFR